MENLEWTPEQEAFYHAIERTRDNILLEAVAGSGKTSSLVEGANRLPPNESTCALAFNRKIKLELEKRLLTSTCLTLNGLGHRGLAKYIGRRPVVESSKTYQIAKEVFDKERPSSMKIMGSVMGLVAKAKNHGLVPSEVQARGLIPDERESWIELMDHYGIDANGAEDEFIGLSRIILRVSIEKALDGWIDFDDQIYMCQPPGTMILTKHGETPIEYVGEGSEVVSYSRATSKVIGRYNHGSRVEHTSRTDYDGTMYKILAEEKETEATDKHKWLVRLNKTRGLWTVYLARRGNSWRIGQSQLISKAPHKAEVLGPIARARVEEADAVWILDIVRSREDACVLEGLYGVRFGIPEHRFKDTLGEAIHRQLGDLMPRGLRCLRAFGKRIDCPLWSVGGEDRNFTHPTVVESCNLEPEFMRIPVLAGDGVEWQEFSIEKSHYKGPVHSLSVQRHELYFANGILTHNSACFPVGFDRFDNIFIDEAQDLSRIQHVLLKKSVRHNGRVIAVGDPNQAIYGFRASMHNSLEELTETFNLKAMGLTVSFRCARSIVYEAQSVYDTIQAAPMAPEGLVHTLEEYGPQTFRDGDAIICRNNGPTIGLAFKLIRSGKGVHVAGRDIGKGLKLLVKKLGGCDLYELSDRIEDWARAECIKAANKDDFHKMDAIMDKADSLVAVIDHSGAANPNELLACIDELFGRQSAPITMSTIHRAKGMEWDRVFFLDRGLIPSKWSRGQEWMLVQEDNLLYVAITRAKSTLTYINSEGWDYG